MRLTSEADEITGEDLIAAAVAFDALTAGRFYAEQVQALRDMGMHGQAARLEARMNEWGQETTPT